MSNPHATRRPIDHDLTWNVTAGASLGFLTGLLVGLSASPVVGSVLVLLVSGVLVFLSLSAELRPKDRPFDRTVLIRVAVFGGATCMALLLGMVLRTTQWLGGTFIQQQYDDLVSIGVEPTDARATILARLKSTPLPAEAEAARGTVVFGSASGEKCRDLDPAQFDTQGAITSYVNAGGIWKDAGEAIRKLVPESDQPAVIRFIYQTQCESRP